MADLIPELKYTPLENIASLAHELRSTFNTQKTKPIEFRLVQLRKLYWGLVDNEPAIVEACKRDLGKSFFEAYLTEIDWCKNDILFVCSNLREWAKDEKAPDVPLANKLMSPKIRKDPLGCVLIIGYVLPLCFACNSLPNDQISNSKYGRAEPTTFLSSLVSGHLLVQLPPATPQSSSLARMLLLAPL